MSFDPTSLVRDYGDPFEEATHCRRSAAVFDFSFVARGRITGADALSVLARLAPRPLDDMQPGQIRYAVRQSASGHLDTDLTIWRHPGGIFEVMSGRRQDIDDLVRLAAPGCAADLTDETAILAVQGPAALAVLGRAGIGRVSALAGLPYYRFDTVLFQGALCPVGRLGYTGEAGFEIIAPRTVAPELWARLSGSARPAGFAAADILRIEAGFVLFAHEFRLPVTAAEAGLSAFVGCTDESPPPAIGLTAFTASAERRPVLWRPAARLERPMAPGALVVTSACWSPHAASVLGLGYARSSDLSAGVPLTDPSGAFQRIVRAARPYVDPKKLRPRAAWRLRPA